MTNSRHYRIAAAAEQSCILQAAAAALQRARACVQSKCVRVRAWCSKVSRYHCNVCAFRLRAVTVLVITLFLQTCSYAGTEDKFKGVAVAGI